MAPNQEKKDLESDKKDQSKLPEPKVVIQKVVEGSIEGQVATREGPMRNATISFGVSRTFTDDKGYFLFEHLPPGFGKIRVKPSSSRFYDSALDVLVEADKRKNLFLFLTEVTGKIEGIVTDESGKPLIGADVWGLFRVGKPEISTKTDEKGRYIFDEVPQGTYFARAKADGRMIEGATVTVPGRGTAMADFKLNSGSLTITGKVVSMNEGTGIDCEIYLMRKGVVVTTATTSSSGYGKFIFDDLTPDIYEIITVPVGYTPKRWSGDIKKSESVIFELEQEEPPTNPPTGP